MGRSRFQLRQFDTRGRGQATVELVILSVFVLIPLLAGVVDITRAYFEHLAVLVMFAMVYGILEIGRLLFINAELENAAREGVYYASRHPTASASDLRDNAIGPKLALIDKNSPDFVVNNPSLPRGIGPYYPVKVTVTYTWTSTANFVPDMSEMTLRPLGPLLLTATSTKLIEGR
jgi:Flp pilus assembly protein TadG